MRILIVGGGVAGLTLAAKLRQQGRESVIVEQSAEYGDAGYAISLYPLGSCVFHGLGLYDEVVSRAQICGRYEIADHAGQVLQSVGMAEFTDNIGPMFTLSRRDLIDVLRNACGELPIRMGMGIETITQADGEVEVAFTDKTKDTFDLVIGCDGIPSTVRQLIFGEQDVFDTGWTIWTWWGREGLIPADLVREYWGRGCLFGFYPAPGRCMFIAGLPTEAIPERHASTETVRSVLSSAFSELIEKVPEIRRAFEDAHTLFRWPMNDVRSREWYSGRVALCGDAAAAFLPTAGVGASNALRGAAALADELSKTDAAHVPLALELYVKRCRKIIEGNQDDSRSVARYVFIESKALGWGRDQIVKHYPASKMLKQIIESMRQPF